MEKARMCFLQTTSRARACCSSFFYPSLYPWILICSREVMVLGWTHTVPSLHHTPRNFNSEDGGCTFSAKIWKPKFSWWVIISVWVYPTIGALRLPTDILRMYWSALTSSTGITTEHAVCSRSHINIPGRMQQPVHIDLDNALPDSVCSPSHSDLPSDKCLSSWCAPPALVLFHWPLLGRSSAISKHLHSLHRPLWAWETRVRFIDFFTLCIWQLTRKATTPPPIYQAGKYWWLLLPTSDSQRLGPAIHFSQAARKLLIHFTLISVTYQH